VEEKDLQHLRTGLKGKLTPTTAPDCRLPVQVEKLSLVPIGAGKFDARFTYQAGDGSPTLLAGMACSIQLVPYGKEDAVSVPASAVFADDLDEDKYHVYLASKEGKPTKKTVVVGKKLDRKVEILEGLKEGDEILLEKPGEGKKAEPPAAGKEVKP